MFLSNSSLRNSFLKTSLLVLLLPLCSLGQDRNIVSFSGGYSLPLGKFASANLNDPEAGLAGAGVFGQLSYER